MRAFGWPSASTVASVMAVGSRGSAAAASFSQAAKSRKGSSAAVKSPLVNQLGCSMGAVSDIRGALSWPVPWGVLGGLGAFIVDVDLRAYGAGWPLPRVF